jgi:hypothetical protein
MMKRLIPIMVVLAAAGVHAQSPATRVAEDAKVIDRVAEASKKDLPDSVLERIVNEDLDLMRGKRADGSYEHAAYERLDSGRDSISVSVQPRKEDQLERIEMKGSWVYRLIIDSHTRRMLVTKNKKVFIDRVELEFIPQGSSNTKHETFKVEEWLNPGQTKAIDFPEVARQATARVFARADRAAGYGNLDLILVRAKVVDNVDSPYADAVSAAKALLRAIEARDIPSIRSMAGRMYDSVASNVTRATPAASAVDVVAATPPPANSDLYSELQTIEDLMTGSENERRQGLDRLHQLLRRLRPAS